MFVVILPCATPVLPFPTNSTHPSLKFLDYSHSVAIWAIHTLVCRFLMLHITLPGLISLSLDCVGNGQSIVSFLTRPSCPLNGLTLHCDSQDYEERLGCLLVVPKLRRLRVLGTKSSAWTGVFTRPNDDSAMLPSLQNLSVQDGDIQDDFPLTSSSSSREPFRIARPCSISNSLGNTRRTIRC
ncbi:hypothetical protein C8F04DRAFT_702240 [Mycena alexandri]|uniref:Uncharacterized protein n=1 Tax=Mycena alexandri TaxID=1745969 RepID=A0AAD6SQ61_9AGAR|nr:hypothetical protein C8F04DRAFT_702240 [Mycena alexandri]